MTEHSGEQQGIPLPPDKGPVLENTSIHDSSENQAAKELPRGHENSPPEASFIVIPHSSHQAEMNIYFDASASRDRDGDILAYYWDFGDGSPLFGPTMHNPVCHRYFKEGDYTVRLTVFDNAGNSGSREMVLHVGESLENR